MHQLKHPIQALVVSVIPPCHSYRLFVHLFVYSLTYLSILSPSSAEPLILLAYLHSSVLTPYKKVVDYLHKFDPWLTCSTATTQQRHWPRMALQLTCSCMLTYSSLPWSLGSMPWSLGRSICAIVQLHAMAGQHMILILFNAMQRSGDAQTECIHKSVASEEAAV